MYLDSTLLQKTLRYYMIYSSHAITARAQKTKCTYSESIKNWRGCK